jgi:hypothetical protein
MMPNSVTYWISICMHLNVTNTRAYRPLVTVLYICGVGLDTSVTTQNVTTVKSLIWTPLNQTSLNPDYKSFPS